MKVSKSFKKKSKKNKECKCEHPEFKVRYFCRKCNLPVRDFFSMRFKDSCSGNFGITDFDGEFKIWRCDHYVYCPLCGWRCKNVKELKEHINCYDSEQNRMVCEGYWRYGDVGVSQVKNEIKYFELKNGK